MTAPLGVGVVGVGMAAKPHLEALARLPELAAVKQVWSRTPGPAEAAAAKLGARASAGLDELLADPAVDAVLLLTPPNARVEIIERCAAAGKAVLAEKPLGRDVAEARRAAAACEQHGVPLGVVLQHRRRDDVRRLQELIAAGALGKLALARLDFPWWRGQEYYDERGRGSKERDGGGVLLTQAVHILDLLLLLLGPVAEVRALAGTSALHRMETEDFAVAGLRFESGALGAVVATTAAYPGTTERLHIDAEKASASLVGNVLEIAWRDGRRERFGAARGTGGGADPMAFGPELHQDLIASFLRAVAAGETPVPGAAEALRVQELVERIAGGGDG
ncbi:MAG: Gfo/Idh/MocA family oxidoreductase [Betaproteobacteria bacterium AqS2]|uniref:Gfo/Idh/MocA family oxidoreductase n=1 Tax=Candidatus Amphirhobacter heronislandensis TaxID=1732024 RepID=A0A930XY96_9GAMM|nr:Gfo/Idh/MocA family oxidoreductase [Betaproteobacteria bacterium AqS2]